MGKREFGQYRESDGHWILCVIEGVFCGVCDGAGCYYVGGYYPEDAPDTEYCDGCNGLGIVGEITELGIDHEFEQRFRIKANCEHGKFICNIVGCENYHL